MRQVVIMTLAAIISMLMMQCSENESLNVFHGRVVTVTAPIMKEYSYLPYYYRIHPDSIILHDSIIRHDSVIYHDSIIRPDSIKWLYECPSGEASRLSIILSGRIETDSIGELGDKIDIGIGQNHITLGVETHTDDVPGRVQLAFDSSGAFLDTVLIDVSSTPELILHQSSRLIVNAGDHVTDTIPLVNPHGAWE